MPNTPYQETREKALPFRENYRQDLFSALAARKDACRRERDAYVRDIFTDPERYRTELRAMFGWPLTEPRTDVKCLQKVFLTREDGYTLYRLQLETRPGLRFSGLLYVREDGKRRPLVLSQHGGLGTPELCGTLYETGSANYNEQTRRLLRWDVNVFAPQLMLWTQSNETSANYIPAQRNQLDVMLKACGGSITALELDCLQSSLDWLSAQDFTDPDRIGMAGLSYGGMYTLFLAAVDPRIRTAVSCSFFGGLTEHFSSDWSWQNGERTFMDAEIAALCWPRRIRLLMGKRDELFHWETSLAQYERLRSLAGALPLEEKITFHPFDGVHEFDWDESHITSMMADLGVSQVSQNG